MKRLSLYLMMMMMITFILNILNFYIRYRYLSEFLHMIKIWEGMLNKEFLHASLEWLGGGVIFTVRSKVSTLQETLLLAYDTIRFWNLMAYKTISSSTAKWIMLSDNFFAKVIWKTFYLVKSFQWNGESKRWMPKDF